MDLLRPSLKILDLSPGQEISNDQIAVLVIPCDLLLGKHLGVWS